MRTQNVDVTLWCTCPRCYGKRFATVTEWWDEHKGLDRLYDHEVSVDVVEPEEDLGAVLTFTGVMNEDDRDLQVLVHAYPQDGFAEVSFRRRSWETWGVPSRLNLEATW